ncbi:MAG TPA: TldD/PmbA family protein [Gemmatimonas aurantiaca]|uniref:TldD/PmbA family protein n=1 Tax=Gemmatimonas aurantiaca TaxID=173480 RepID=A0A3D4V7D2_9BACT|nr:TldD/PmbA family protein [Gemmatimonas aurantiaca]HCT57053.1 TldD/PmbA family protein [Gemmatimonas aurantiaca]
MTTRRDFLRNGSVALGGLAVAPSLLSATGAPLGGYPGLLSPAPLPPLSTDAPTRELMMEALDAAKRAGASWADVRISRNRNNSVQTRERQVTDVVDTDTMGCGVRVLVDGCWGFAATQELTKPGVGGAAQEAVAIAKANRVARDRRVELAPTPAHPNATWRSSYVTDPFTIAVEEKADLLLRANAAALTVANVRFVNSGLSFVKEERNYANTEGSVITQDYVRSWVTMSCTAVAPDRSGTAVRGPEVVQPAGRGWEYVLEADIVTNAKVWAAEAAEKLTAKAVEPGRYDLILHPSQLFLTIHESIGHSTELDRAMGYEANYAGTSFISPPDKVLGSLRLGPSMMNVVGNRSEVGALATIGYDDDGVQPEDFHIVKDGVFVDYQTTREQAPWLRAWYEKNGKPVRSHGCAYAQSWADVSFQRMPNVSLQPGDKDLGWDDLIAATDKGIAMIGRASYSIDQQRYNAQFGAQLCYEIRKGKIVGQVKDAAYQMRTPDFWNTLDMLGGKKSYMHGGTFNDGKGQPGQANAVSHGCPPARFRNANIINTGRAV